MIHPHFEVLKQAANAIKLADGIFIGSGAGMGVSSGLGTFRGRNAGVWPPLERRGMDFSEMSCPDWFDKNPNFAWAFWNYRYVAYTTAEPHQGYTILKEIADKKRLGGFSFTSNIDGHWIAAGFPEDRVVECHGSVRYMQCHKECSEAPCKIWPAPHEEITQLVLANDEHVNNPLPSCIGCKGLSRPNVLMFGDFGWIDERNTVQRINLIHWKKTIKKGDKIVVVELGAGKAIPTVRYECEKRALEFGAILIRINLDDSDIKSGGISIPMGALEALVEIKKLMDDE